MDIGNRVFYDQDGEILFQTGVMSGGVIGHKDISEVNFVELAYNSVNYETHVIVGIDPNTKSPILQEIVRELPPEHRRIKELEDQLLLMADANTGGIL